MKNICDWDNCMEIGEFKAPIEKDNSKNFRLLCLNHIKIFASKEAKQWGARAIQTAFRFMGGSVDDWLEMCRTLSGGTLTRPFIEAQPSELPILRDFLIKNDESILDNIKDKTILVFPLSNFSSVYASFKIARMPLSTPAEGSIT